MPTQLPQLTPQALSACSFPAWFSSFQPFSFPSTLIPISQPFVDYLLDQANGIHLPLDVDDPACYTSQLSDSESEPDQPDDSDHDNSDVVKPYRFPELSLAITQAIHQHGGSVFPKLNWSAPQDAAFLLPSGDGPLCCKNAQDVYLVLKSSDCVFHDLDLLQKLNHPSDHQDHDQPDSFTPIPPVLVLRRWYNLNPAHEFRCFVREKKLIAISARSSTHFDFLLEPAVREAIIARISRFHESIVLPRFSLSDFIFDVYLNRPTATTPNEGSSLPLKPNLKLIDLNPFATYIDSCLFDYEELDHLHLTFSGLVTLKLVEKVDGHHHHHQKSHPQPFYHKFSSCRIPV